MEERETKLLIECGVSFKKLQAAAGFAGYSISRLCGCLVSHEHKDHSYCWEQLVRSGIPIYATEGTARALCANTVEYFGTGPFTVLDGETEAGIYRYDAVRIGCFDVIPFRTFHDAAEPVGFYLRSCRCGEALVFATDTGNLAYRWADPPVIVAVECNYAPALLERAERLPKRVRERITKTHMSSEKASRFLAELDRSRLREVYLLHLSDATSDARIFRKVAEQICGPGVNVTICPREPLTV